MRIADVSPADGDHEWQPILDILRRVKDVAVELAIVSHHSKLVRLAEANDVDATVDSALENMLEICDQTKKCRARQVNEAGQNYAVHSSSSRWLAKSQSAHRYCSPYLRVEA